QFKKAVGDTTALYGLVCGPFTLASHLRGTNIFMDMYDDEEYVDALLSYAADVAITMADYYIDAGMDVLGAVDPLVSQISPDSFSRFLSKPYKRFFDHIRERGVFSSFFVCGDATKNLEVMCQAGPDCLSIDENIDLAAAKKITDTYNIVISGNLQLTVVMLLGNQKDSQKAALEKIDAMGTTNFILAPGCDLPFEVPIANVIGVAQAVQNVEATRKFLESYVKEDSTVEVELPDYKNLDHILIEVLTIDSATCAACGYMKAAADEVAAVYKGRTVKVVERKILEPENIVRLGKMGVSNLPTIALHGVVSFISVIPNRQELTAAIDAIK
ncbi:MAG: uroporphyrinogen decarboxylase, partial [Spirochaetes bacterium]|nr:uroporphyrinogen decarboxylase [Spirochaetota bacterium]